MTMPTRILIVDDESRVRMLLTRYLESEGYTCAVAHDGQEAADQIRRDDAIDLVISDIRMPRLDGMQLLDRIIAERDDLPVVMITSVSDIDTGIAALRRGAAEFLLKPFNLEAVAIAVERALERQRLVVENREYQRDLETLVEEKTASLRVQSERIAVQAAKLSCALEELEEASNATLRVLAAAIETRDTETSQHNERVQRHSCLLGRKMGQRGSALRDLSWGALLHDVGKIGVPDSILRKPGRLTPAEWDQMKRHPEVGFQILSAVPFLEGAAQVALHHHERYDGSGYPHGTRGEAIPLHARMFAVVDAFDAMTSDRPYQSACSVEEAIDEITACSGSHFDPEVVDAFLALPESDLRGMGAPAERPSGVTRSLEWSR